VGVVEAMVVVLVLVLVVVGVLTVAMEVVAMVVAMVMAADQNQVLLPCHHRHGWILRSDGDHRRRWPCCR